MDRKDPLRPKFIYDVCRVIWMIWFKVFHCVSFRGQHSIPSTGPIIFCPNHISYYDPPLVGLGVPFATRFMAWDALFKVPVLGPLIRYLGAFPVRLKSADKAAIEQTLQVLRSKHAVMIFPEGGRSFTGELMPFEAGAFRMAAQTGATIVPVSILGMFEAWPAFETFPSLFRPIIVKYHAPIRVDPNIPRSKVKELTESLSSEVRRVIERRQSAFERYKKMQRARGVWGRAA
jgi:1-acyl-sn-glycerol-3-phosphate acyltransferase